MNKFEFSRVEKAFRKESGVSEFTTKLPYILVDNFPKLGKLTALRFLEWVVDNPQGVISLPTGKTPEYFITWTKHLLKHWNEPDIVKERKKYGFNGKSKPELQNLHFVQIDEFYPISPLQHNSFYHYVKKFYLEGFGIKPENALLINCDEILLSSGRHFKEVFPDHIVDTSLRYRDCRNEQEKIQQESIFFN